MREKGCVVAFDLSAGTKRTPTKVKKLQMLGKKKKNVYHRGRGREAGGKTGGIGGGKYALMKGWLMHVV